MAKKKAAPVTKSLDSVYSYIIVNKTKRASITILVIGVTVALGSFTYANLLYEIHWGVWAFPACLLAGIVLVAPISEEWNYKPWQKFPQQVEHHHND